MRLRSVPAWHHPYCARRAHDTATTARVAVTAPLFFWLCTRTPPCSREAAPKIRLLHTYSRSRNDRSIHFYVCLWRLLRLVRLPPHGVSCGCCDCLPCVLQCNGHFRRIVLVKQFAAVLSSSSAAFVDIYHGMIGFITGMVTSVLPM
jgi:hypothetical protein